MFGKKPKSGEQYTDTTTGETWTVVDTQKDDAGNTITELQGKSGAANYVTQNNLKQRFKKK